MPGEQRIGMEVRYRAGPCGPTHLPRRMDDDNVTAADLEDMRWRAGVCVRLIRLGLKPHLGSAARALQSSDG